MNCFNRNIELSDGLETDYIRLLYYEFDHYYKDFYKSYEYYRVCTIIEGSKHIEVDNADCFDYNKDQFVVLPPESAVTMEMTEPTKCLVLEISDALLDKICNKVCINTEAETSPLEREKHPLFKGSSSLIESDLEKIKTTALGDSNGKEFLIDLYVQEMTYKLLSYMSNCFIINKKFNHPVNRAIELMKTGYRQNISLSEIAGSLNMSQSHFSICFKKITGLSPNVYYTNIKLNEAKKMLKDNSVTEVAYDLGYDNISHFIRLFFEKFRITPKQFQIHNYSKTL